jgi:hypothetical protein
MPTTKKPAAPLAHYATKTVTPVINDFADWIESEVGMTLSEQDRLVLLLGSSLRATFQKSGSNQKRLSDASARVAARKVAREQRAAARIENVAKPEPAKPSMKPAPAPAASAAKRRRPLKAEAAK